MAYQANDQEHFSWRRGDLIVSGGGSSCRQITR